MHQYSPLSIQSLSAQPGVAIASACEAGWQSLYVEERLCPIGRDPFEAAPTPDQTIVVFLEGSGVLECSNGGRWRSAYRPKGSAGLTAPGEPDRLRWGAAASGREVRAAYIYLPPSTIEEAQDSLGKRPSGGLSALRIDDPVLYGLAAGLTNAARCGAPELYAQSLATYLAVHLACITLDGLAVEDRVSSVRDRRIQRAIDYIAAHLDEDIRMETLAGEACLSPYHFMRVFKRHTGQSPMGYLASLRMKLAEQLLRDTDLPVGAVAARCGYSRPAAFASAVRRHLGLSPSRLRGGLS